MLKRGLHLLMADVWVRLVCCDTHWQFCVFHSRCLASGLREGTLCTTLIQTHTPLNCCSTKLRVNRLCLDACVSTCTHTNEHTYTESINRDIRSRRFCSATPNALATTCRTDKNCTLAHRQNTYTSFPLRSGIYSCICCTLLCHVTLCEWRSVWEVVWVYHCCSSPQEQEPYLWGFLWSCKNSTSSFVSPILPTIW